MSRLRARYFRIVSSDGALVAKRNVFRPSAVMRHDALQHELIDGKSARSGILDTFLDKHILLTRQNRSAIGSVDLRSSIFAITSLSLQSIALFKRSTVVLFTTVYLATKVFESPLRRIATSSLCFFLSSSRTIRRFRSLLYSSWRVPWLNFVVTLVITSF